MGWVLGMTIVLLSQVSTAGRQNPRRPVNCAQTCKEQGWLRLVDYL